MSILEVNRIRPFSGTNVTISSLNNVQIQADLHVSGTVTAENFHTTTVQTTVLAQSGSTQLGNSADDTHTIVGGIYHTGQTEQTGFYYLTGDITQSGDYRLNGNKLHIGNLVQTGNLALTGTGSINGRVEHVGYSQHTGDFSISGSFTNTGGDVRLQGTNIDLFGDVTLDGTLTSTSGSNTNLQGILEIAGITNVSSSISILTTDLRITSNSLETRITNISSSFSTSETALSSSIALSITNLDSSTSASDAALDTRVTTAESHISNLHAFTGSLDDTYATDAELSAVSGALATSINTSVAGLNAASSSYALAADLTVATASIAANQASIGAINAATSSFAFTTGSIFTGKQELTGSIDVSGSISIKPTGDGLTNRLSFDTSEFHAKSPGFYWMTDSITIGSNDESTLFAALDSTRLQLRTLLSLYPVSTKPDDLTAGTFAVSGSTPIYCDGENWYPINLGTALP
jgi:hypothetical protein